MLLFEVNGQKLTRIDKFKPATDSVKYLQAKFTFKSTDWNGKTKTAFFRLGDTVYKALLNGSGICTVPAEVLIRSDSRYARNHGSRFFVSVIGEYSTTRITTNEVETKLNTSGYGDAEEPASPTESECQQIITQYAKNEAAINEAKAECETARADLVGVKNIFANAIKGNLSGTVVFADDVSPVEHNPIVKVHGKNLLKAEAGASWQCNVSVASDGKIILTNTEASGVAFARVGTIELKKGKTYVYSRFEPNNIMNVLTWYTGTTNDAIYPVNGQSFTPEKDMIVDVAVYMADIATVGNTASIYIQIEEGETATEYKAWVDPSTITVTRCGRNLLPKRTTAGTNTGNGVTQKMNVDGSVTITGTATAPAYLGIENIYNLPKGVYYVTGNTSAESFLIAGAYNGDAYVFEAQDRGEGVILDLTDKTFDHVRVMMYVPQGITVSKTVYPMLSADIAGKVFEAPQGTTTHTPNADGTVEGITSLAPNMTILADTEGAIVECEYIKDTNKVVQKLAEALNITI